MYNLYMEPSITKNMKKNRLRWAGHVVRRQLDDPIFRVWQSTFVDGRRGRGRPKNSWTESISADFRAVRISNWKATAQDREEFRRILNAVENHTGLGP